MKIQIQHLFMYLKKDLIFQGYYNHHLLRIYLKEFQKKIYLKNKILIYKNNFQINQHFKLIQMKVIVLLNYLL